MKHSLFLFIAILPLMLCAQTDSIQGKVYAYQTPATSVNNIASAVLFKGSTYDLSYAEMTANIITGNKKISFQHKGKECLLIGKSGTLLLNIDDQMFPLDSGSIALLMPWENCWVQNASKDPCAFYAMTYTSKQPPNGQRGMDAGGSEVINWNNVAFTPHDKGGIRRFLDRPTAMLQHFEIHASTLNEGLKSHEPHTHRAAEIVVMIDGNTEMQIGNNFYKGKAGDVYYLPSNVPHAIRNDDKNACMYFAFQFQ